MMALPELITVTGTIVDSVGPVAGRLVWVRSAALRPADTSDPEFAVPQEIETIVGVDGTFTQQIYATNDPAASPTGFTWEVRPHFPGWNEPFTVSIPYDSPGAAIKFSQLAPVPADGTGELYALASHTHAGGGGGSGPDPATTVVAETAYGAASSAGNSALYSRGNHTHGTPSLPTPAAIGAASTTDLTTHAADTTAVHGITDTADLVLTGDSRLSNARTPTAHAASHADGGSDEVSIDASQITTGTVAIARVPTGTSGTTVALGDAPTGAVTTHVGGADPHTQYRRTYFETAGTYAVVTGARDFIGPDDPATEGFTLADGDKWYET